MNNSGGGGNGSGLGLGGAGASTSSAHSPSQSTDIDEYEHDDDAGYWRVAATHQELYQAGGMQFPFNPETADAAAAAAAAGGAGAGSGLPYDSSNRPMGISKSPSSCSLPYSHSRQSSLELPLPLEAPVVGDFQRMSGLPPLPVSARSTGAVGFGGSSGSLGLYGGQPSGISSNNSPAPPPVASSGLSGLGGGNGNGFVTGAWLLQHQNSSGNRSRSSLDLEPYERSPPGAEGNAQQQPLNRDTARWVFDRQNSAGSDAYKSLLSFLDQQSPRTLPLPLGSTGTLTEGEAGTTGPSPRTPTGEAGAAAAAGGSGGTCCETPRPTGSAAAPPAAKGIDKQPSAPDIDTARHMEKQQLDQQPPWLEPSAGELADRDIGAGGNGDGNLSPVSSLSESVMQEVLMETFKEVKLNEASAVTSPFEEGRQAGPGVGDAAASTAAVGVASASASAPELEFDIASSRDTPQTDEEEEGDEDILQREEQDRPREQRSTTLRSVKTTTTAAATTRGESPQDSTTATAGGGSPTPGGVKGDLFSFPVTSPSERAGGERAAAAGGGALGRVFASWPSFKNSGSPARSGGEGGYCSNEEEMTPQSKFGRRGHRPRLSTASSTGNFAGIPLPPAAPTHLALKFPQPVRQSRSQQGLATIVSSPLSSGQYSDLALYEYNDRAFDEKYDVLDLKIIHRRGATGFEATREIPLRINDLIGGRYQIVDLLGQAAFCRAVQALDLKTGALVCLKVVKNNKDYVDQSLDEIKVLRYINNADPGDEQGILRLYDYFYFKEHLILVTELLRANLYEFTKYNRESGAALYFTMPRIQSIAWQVLRSLAFLHSLNLIHADLKPENILMKSYSACEVKIIDLGSSCFITDRLSSYVQSRSYRAPEVILGLPYGQKIDVWSLGCILAELATGKVLFHNSTPPAILARVEGILGPIPQNMISRGKYSPRFFTHDGRIFEKNSQTGQVEFLRPKRSSLSRRVGDADAGLLDFITCLLQVDPARRPSAAEALYHPWLIQRY